MAAAEGTFGGLLCALKRQSGRSGCIAISGGFKRSFGEQHPWLLKAISIMVETSLARYLRDARGQAVYIASLGVFSAQLDNSEMSRLPPWAQAFEERMQPTPEKTVTKEEALVALDAV